MGNESMSFAQSRRRVEALSSSWADFMQSANHLLQCHWWASSFAGDRHSYSYSLGTFLVGDKADSVLVLKYSTYSYVLVLVIGLSAKKNLNTTSHPPRFPKFLLPPQSILRRVESSIAKSRSKSSSQNQHIQSIALSSVITKVVKTFSNLLNSSHHPFAGARCSSAAGASDSPFAR
ncbi:hypothetical protein ACMFMG_006198 [Clarireedia jacksonii]